MYKTQKCKIYGINNVIKYHVWVQASFRCRERNNHLRGTTGKHYALCGNPHP